LIVNGRIENVRGSDGRDVIRGNLAYNLIFGDQSANGIGGNDTITAVGFNDTIYGGSGNDSISFDNCSTSNGYGGAGSDTLRGDGYNLEFSGGAGADVLSGGPNNNNSLNYKGSPSGVTIALTYGELTIGIGGDAEGDRISGFDNIYGSRFDDILTDTTETWLPDFGNESFFKGYGGNDRLELGGGNDDGDGGLGNDRIYGGAGRDWLRGAQGSDTMYGGDGNDTVGVIDDGNDLLFGGAGADGMAGGDNRDTLFGGYGADTLSGGLGLDTLFGGAGDDLLEGGSRADILTGDDGGDYFYFTKWYHSRADAAERDTITDFNQSDGDKIYLRDMDAIEGPGFRGFTFIGTADFSGAAGELRVRASTFGDYWVVEGNVNADSTADFTIRVDNVTSLIESDFLL
jgi:serralysin